MKVSILAVGVLVCLGIAFVEARMFSRAGKNGQLHMLEKAKRTYMKRDHEAEDDDRCKLKCEDYGLISYVYSEIANQLIYCYTYDVWGDYLSRRSESGTSEEENEEESEEESEDYEDGESAINFVKHSCDFFQQEAEDEFEAWEDPEYKPKIYTCAEYQYFLLALSCLSTYTNLAEFYFAQWSTWNFHQNELISFLEWDMLHQCHDLFYGPYCLSMHLTDHPNKTKCHIYDKDADFGYIYGLYDDDDSSCDTGKKSTSTLKEPANPRRKISHAEVAKKMAEQDAKIATETKAANAADKVNVAQKIEAKNTARSKEFENLKELKSLLQTLLANNKN